MGAPWTREDAINFCGIVEQYAPIYGAHVALTGGCLYKDGPRKDCDIVVYRIRQAPSVDWDGLFSLLSRVGVVRGEDHGWCKKATWGGRDIDFFDPEDDGIYGQPDEAIPLPPL